MNKIVQPDSENGSIQLPFRQKKHSCQCCCCLTHTPYTFWGPHLSHSPREAGSIICASMSEPSGKKRKNISSPADHHTAWTSVVTQALPTSQSFPDIIHIWILTSSIDQEYFNTQKKNGSLLSFGLTVHREAMQILAIIRHVVTVQGFCLCAFNTADKPCN